MPLPPSELQPIIALLREIDALTSGEPSSRELESFAIRSFDDISTAYYRTVWDRLPPEARAAIEDDDDAAANADATLAAFRTTEIGRLFYFLEASVQFFHQPMHYTDVGAVRAFRQRCRDELNPLLATLTSR